MKDIKSWLDCYRDDLNIIPKAIELGWEPQFNYKDKMYNRITIDHCPHDTVSFKKGIVHTWKCYKSKSESYISFWQVADLIDGHFRNHRQYDEINDVFLNENL